LNPFRDIITDLDAYVSDLADTAAQIEHLDLVISVDTAVAHLAGALGIRTWVLLPYSSDWRWLHEGESSLWYPTMKLFRQRRPGEWHTVVGEVASALSALTDEK
jgi:ADP-heptose:LPS heptosyltransferase